MTTKFHKDSSEMSDSMCMYASGIKHLGTRGGVHAPARRLVNPL